MPKRKFSFFIPILIGAVLLADSLVLLTTQRAAAQCGSQASSCKNCHETQGQDSVNSDGTAWHTEHAQIDACVSCHAGNPQSTDKTQAHTGMVAWYSDIKAGCASCHPNDYEQLAQVCATTLGVTIGSGGPAPTAGAAQPTAAPAAAMVVTGNEPVAPAGTIDYVQQYQETVLGERPINWGNVIVVLMILFMLIGGGVFVYWNERRRRGLKGFFSGKAVVVPDGSIPVVEGYSNEVAALLPQIARLNPMGLHALKRILADPEQANELLQAISHLDPELVRRVQALDKDSRAMLIAMAGS